MTKAVKEFLLDSSTGEVDVEYSDNTTTSFNLANAVTATQSAQGVVIEGVDAVTAKKSRAGAPIIAAGTWTGIGTPKFVDFGFTPDLVIAKAPGRNAVFFVRPSWRSAYQAFGNLVKTGSNSINPPEIIDAGLQLGVDADTNGAGETIHYIAIADNGSGILKTWAYNGYATSVGTSAAVTMDLIAGTNPNLVYIKRDAITRAGVFATPSWVKCEDTNDLENSILTLAADGTLSLTTDPRINENNGGVIGEGHNCFSLHNVGEFWSQVDYVGTGSAFRLDASTGAAGIIIIPRGPQRVSFWTATMGSQAADGQATALYDGRISVNDDTSVSIGHDVSVNTQGVSYTAIILRRNTTPQAAKKRCRRDSGVRITTDSTGHISCGTDASLAVTGAHSLEWIGYTTNDTSEQFLMGRIDGATTNPTAGTCNFALTHVRDADCGLIICTSDRLFMGTVDADKQKRYRTGYVLQPYTPTHVLYTHDGVDKWMLYINGEPVKWRRLAMSIFSLPGITGTAGLTMSFNGRVAAGSWVGAKKSATMFGRLYNRALTAAEANQMFVKHFLLQTRTDIADTATALVEEWAFNDGTGTTVTATKSAANNGTITQGAYFLRAPG